jgi:cell division protein FtsQ
MPRDTKKMKPVKAAKGAGWRKAAVIALAGALFVSTAMAALRVRRYALSDPQFRLSPGRADALTLQGLRYTSRPKVQHVFAADFGRSIFAVPLEERRRRLLAIDWIEDATVSRVWPDRLSVHIRERRPVAFVFFRSGVLLVDANGVLLDPPARAQFTFPVLSGVREDESEAQRVQRVRKLLQVEQEIGPAAKDLSEVNAADLDNIHIVAQVEQRAVELILGDANFGQRYQNFVSHYAEIRRRSPEVKTFDLRLEDRITGKE